jgi:hypothetical protein
MTPTPEQTDCIDKFLTGKTLRIGAYAGTGKTTVLTMLAKETNRRGVYLAFNKSIADEAGRKFPGSVSCSTQHSLAFRSFRGVYSFEKLSGSLSAGFVASKMKMPTYEIDPLTFVNPRTVSFMALKAISRWCNSGRDELQPYDVKMVGKMEDMSKDTQDGIRAFVLDRAKELWERMVDRKSDIPLGHGGYLKLWAMGKPKLPGDFILLDEAQDSSGVILELMRHQSAQLIAVGDANQQIYEWRGALNAMTELPVDLESRLSTSFRFGPKLAENATRILRKLGETLPLTGNPEKTGIIGPCGDPEAILYRTNARMIEGLLGFLDGGITPCVIGGVRELIDWIGAAEKLMRGQAVDYPLDFFGFKDWSEVQKHVETDEGEEMKRVVNLIDDHGPAKLRSSLESLPNTPEKADVILSTGHKAKGLEFESVRLCDDFLKGVKTPAELQADKDKAVKEGVDYVEPDIDAELRLFYVACTRAKRHLDIPDVLTEKLKMV